MQGVPWIRVAKFVIGAVVIVGLVFAMRNAGLQWQQQLESLGGQIDAIDEQLARLNQTPGTDPNAIAELDRARSDLLRSVPSAGNVRWGYVAVAAILYAIGLFPPGWLLRKAIRAMGQSCNLPIAMAAQVVGHLGKYVPGKAMVVLIRAGILRQHGVAVSVATVAVFVETFLMMAVGGVIGGVLVWRLPVANWIRFSSLVVAGLAVVPTLPPVLRQVLAIVNRKRNDPGELPDSISLWGVFLVGWVSAVFAWACVASSFAFLVVAVPNPEPLTLANVAVVSSAAICLATVLGFASLIPGGIGVRELVLTGVLVPVVGPSHALLAAIAARILFLIVECVCVAGCWKWLKATHPRPSVASTGETV